MFVRLAGKAAAPVCYNLRKKTHLTRMLKWKQQHLECHEQGWRNGSICRSGMVVSLKVPDCVSVVNLIESRKHLGQGPLGLPVEDCLN